MAIFVCESGADKRRVFPLTAGTLVCGRSEKADILIQDPFLSSRHFSVTSKNGSWFVEDLGSSNGMEINDAIVPAAKLEDGDLLRAGSTYLRFYEKDESASDAARSGLPVIDGYEISERIGVGGMGEVYRARQCSLDREVALKILSPSHARDREFVSKFFREARAAGNLNHPNIVQVHDVGECGGICFMCMEFVGGGDLTCRLNEEGRMQWEDALRVIMDVAHGLEFAEGKQLVHCDIKPDNIMFTESGMAKIADLGIARSASGYQERRKEVFGSPHYMAPEQAMGKPVDCRADLYALGCTLFRMLTGRTPFSGSTAREVMKKQVMEPHPDVIKLAPDCPPEVADIVDFLMEKKPEERCPSATELLRLLEKSLLKKNTKSSKKDPRKTTRKKAAVLTPSTSRAPVAGTIRRGSGGFSLGAKLAVLAAVVILGLVVYKVSTGNRNPAGELFFRVDQKEREGDYLGAIQMLKAYGAADNHEMAERMANTLARLEKAQSLSGTKVKFQRLWNEYLTIRGNASKDTLQKKLEFMASLLDENYPEELRILNAERMRVMNMKSAP